MKKKQSKIYLFPAAMLGITATAGMIANIPGANADDNPAIDDTINITVDSSCTMGQTVTSAHTTELNPGETNTTIGQSRIAAYCNDNEGYAIYAIGYTNGEYGNTNLVSTDGNHTIPTGISGDNSYWSMRLTHGTATGTTSYLPTMVNEFTTNTTIPNDYTKVAYRDSSTISQNQDPTETGSYFTTTYAAHVGTTQLAGIYNGQVQYVMVHPSSAPQPEVPPTYMQDTATIKAKLTNTGDTMQAIDSRDGKKYWITKLADGNIWMTQNLDLDLSTQTALTPANTNITTNWTPANTTIVFTDTYVSGWDNNERAPYSADPGDVFYYSSGDTSNDTQYTSLEACQAEHPDCSMHNHVGNYYNWSAAVASNNTYSIKNNHTSAPGSICPAGWRLPKVTGNGSTTWSNEWGGVLVAENIVANSINNNQSYVAGGFDKMRVTPLWITRAGAIEGGSVILTSNNASYWFSTAFSQTGAYFLGISRIVSPSGSDSRSSGQLVRCLVE